MKPELLPEESDDLNFASETDLIVVLELLRKTRAGEKRRLNQEGAVEKEVSDV